MIELKDIKQLVGMEYFSETTQVQSQKEPRPFNGKNCVATNMITKIKTKK